ncbi:MAG TPA: DUF3604 domain-containing protein [Myxococcales bacterium]|nr:DUF3604 domain-containing protein [Myxococcales bacterium]HIL81345.1 DUF3604 domain-containing protein [Myxococcales bacterium]
MSPSRIARRTTKLTTLVGLAGLGLFSALASGEVPDEGSRRPWPVSEARAPCADYAPERRPFFGDTHVHTTFSQDASTQDTRATPRDAYRFARGAPLGIQPYTKLGRSQRTVQLDRPLDFTVVTDHAEQLGETHICKTPGATGHDSLVCRIYRRFPRVAFYLMNARYAVLGTRWGFCGEGGEHCKAAAGTIWDETQSAAEEAYDRTAACEFTSFVGYEWTAGPGGGAHLHRNVIFRNEKVPTLPISVMETGFPAVNLWKALDVECRNGRPGCQAITIPHNSNIGGGYTFTSARMLDGEIDAEEAVLRERYDRLAEVMQHKGDSECMLDPSAPDEACGFEKLTSPRMISYFGDEPLRPTDYVRNALKRGLALEGRLGTNPLKYGMIASTDTHLGTPGLTRERGHPGHGGGGKPAGDGVPEGLPDNLLFGPGGLAVLWAEENSRDALFESMLRREVYGTSGTRPVLRFFGGWKYEPEICDATDLSSRGYAGGVPMGGDLTVPPAAEAAPTFVVAALRDSAPDGAPLQRVEIIKGWVEGDSLHEEVFLVAGGENGADVDLSTCERQGTGADRLCSVWRDADFDPQEPAFYYARVLENPVCRWSQWACVEAGVDCGDPGSIRDGFEPCCSEDHRPTVRERAWSSPIWFAPR